MESSICSTVVAVVVVVVVLEVAQLVVVVVMIMPVVVWFGVDGCNGINSMVVLRKWSRYVVLW